MEPRNRYRCGSIISSASGRESRRCEASGRQQSRDRHGEICATPPGSVSGACIQRGGSGTGEAHKSPCRKNDRKKRGTGRPRALGAYRQLSAACVSRKLEHEEGKSAGYRETSKREVTREGLGGVLAEHRTDGVYGQSHTSRVGGEPRPKGPTVGKAKPGMTLSWRER